MRHALLDFFSCTLFLDYDSSTFLGSRFVSKSNVPLKWSTRGVGHTVAGREPGWSSPNVMTNKQASKRHKELTNPGIAAEYMW